MNREPSPLHAAKLAVMEAVPYVQKTHIKNLGYSAATEAELIAHLQPAMVRHGLTVAPVGSKLLASSRYQTAKGVSMHHVLLEVTYRLTHAASGTSEDVQVIGESADSSDKSAGKAMTMAFKTALRQAFLIETGDDPDTERPDGPAPKEAAKSTNGKAPAKPTTNGNGHAMPADGLELKRRLRLHDAKLAAEGLCTPGAFAKAVLPPGGALANLGSAGIAAAVALARQVEQELRARSIFPRLGMEVPR